jgi:UDP-N-acetylglucosamine 2-epimerase (hydrolysing)
MGIESSIHTIGSPDIDIMFSEDLPNIDDVKKYYEIPLRILLCNVSSLTTEATAMKAYVQICSCLTNRYP